MAVRINTPDDGPFAPGRFDIVAEMDIRRHHVETPEEDAVAVLSFLRCRRHGAAHDILESLPFGRSADGPIQFRSAQTVKQSVQSIMLDNAHGAGIGIRQDGFGTTIGNNRLPPFSNLRQGLVPGNGCKLAASLGPGPLQRHRQAARRMDGPFIMGHLRAQRPARKRMGPIAGDGHDAAVVDRNDKPAGIGAVIRADRCIGFHDITSCFVARGSWLVARGS